MVDAAYQSNVVITACRKAVIRVQTWLNRSHCSDRVVILTVTQSRTELTPAAARRLAGALERAADRIDGGLHPGPRKRKLPT